MYCERSRERWLLHCLRGSTSAISPANQCGLPNPPWHAEVRFIVRKYDRRSILARTSARDYVTMTTRVSEGTGSRCEVDDRLWSGHSRAAHDRRNGLAKWSLKLEVLVRYDDLFPWQCAIRCQCVIVISDGQHATWGLYRLDTWVANWCEKLTTKTGASLYDNNYVNKVNGQNNEDYEW